LNKNSLDLEPNVIANNVKQSATKEEITTLQTPRKDVNEKQVFKSSELSQDITLNNPPIPYLE
jgi:hypothetical protein